MDYSGAQRSSDLNKRKQVEPHTCQEQRFPPSRQLQGAKQEGKMSLGKGQCHEQVCDLPHGTSRILERQTIPIPALLLDGRV